MGDKISDNNLHDEQETEAVETISLTDFPIAQDHGVSTIQDHVNPPLSSAAEDFFEFFRGGLGHNSTDKTMSHADDIIFCGKLIPINEQPHNNKIPLTAKLLLNSEKNNIKTEEKFSSVTRSNKSAPANVKKHYKKTSNQPVGCQRSRSESTADSKRTTASPLIRASRSLDYKRLNRNSSMSSEPAVEISRNGSGKKSSSSRWYVLLFGLVKVPPPEMDIRDIKNRQVRRSTSKTPLASSESFKVIPVNRSDDHRKCSWRVLGFLSCKSSSSAAVTMPVGYMPKV